MTTHKYLRKKLLFLLSSVLALFFLSSCQKQPNLLFGSTYANENNSANVVLVDSTSVLLSTVYVDSTATSGTGFFMVGEYNDPYLGKVTSRAFWQLAPPTTLPTLSPVNDRFDSLGLILFFKKSNPYYGDTTALQTYYVNQVDTLYQLANFSRGWFSNSSLSINPTPLGQTNPIYISPNRPYTSQGILDTVKVPLDAAMGRQIYNMVLNLSDTVKSPIIWNNWFHGLCLSSSSTPKEYTGAVYGFSDSAIMRIYYREAGVVSTVKFIDFGITNLSNQFNNIRHDFSGSVAESLRLPPTDVYAVIPPATRSDSTNHAAFVQSIGGLNVKLSFPGLASIAQRPDYIGLLRAQLTVRPVPASFNPEWRLPPQLGIFLTDQNNQIGSPIPALGAPAAQTGNLSLNYFDPLSTTYTYDVTAFVKQQITNTGPNASQMGLMLSVPAPANVTDFRRLIIADQSYNVNQRINLSVYYISLFPHN